MSEVYRYCMSTGSVYHFSSAGAGISVAAGIPDFRTPGTGALPSSLSTVLKFT